MNIETHSREDGEAGFTLVELLVVLAIIAMLATLVGPRVLGYLGTAKADTAGAQVRNLGNAVELFSLDVGRYPTDAEGLQALTAAPADAPGWSGPYLKGSGGLDDPWGRPYLYKSDDKTYVVGSLGRDGKAGGTGEDADISSR